MGMVYNDTVDYTGIMLTIVHCLRYV